MRLVEHIPTPAGMHRRPAAPLTRADLDRMPDDGYRYELIDGSLLMTPAPSWGHQNLVANLLVQLRLACPPDLCVLTAPFDVVLAPDTIMQPDILVARREAFTKKDLPGPPLLAVEVLSPSTRRFDLMTKWSRFEAAGCAAYWVLDPDTPSLIAWEMGDRAYVQVAKVTGDEPVRLTSPFELTVVPSNLIS